MKICVLQAPYADSTQALAINDPSFPDPAMFTSQHEFHHRYINKATANAQIDAAVAEGFDMFLNFMWGQLEDTVAGIEATEYLESLGVPIVGYQSKVLRRSKLDFYNAAKKSGLPVPARGADMKFPVFVKPAKMCASMFIDERSVCKNQSELDQQLARINEYLAPGRKEAAATIANHCNRSADGNGSAHVNGSDHDNGSVNGNRIAHVDGSDHVNDSANVNGVAHFDGSDTDIVVQEYIPGRDYSVILIEMGNTPVALNPTTYRCPAINAGADFMTFDIKFHPEMREELLVRCKDPTLFDMLRNLAERAWHVNQMAGNSWGNVDIRVRASDGKPFILEVNAGPAVFYRWEHEWEDIVIRETFPGGHRALVNVMINSRLQQLGKHKIKAAPVAKVFDSFSTTYESYLGTMASNYEFLIADYDYSGTMFELGSGTGKFSRMLHEHQRKRKDGIELSTIVGNDVSEQMVQKNPIPETYKEVKIGPLQDVIMDTTTSFDHVVCVSTLQYLDEVEMCAVLVRMFQLAQKSVTISVDEIPDSHNEAWVKAGFPFLQVKNHLQLVEGFGVPRGWRVGRRVRKFGWTSPNTGHNVDTVLFRFEALPPL